MAGSKTNTGTEGTTRHVNHTRHAGSRTLLSTPCAQTQHWQSGTHCVWCTTQHSLRTNTTLTVGNTPCLMHYSALPAHKRNTNSRENTVSDALLSTPCAQTQHWQSGTHRVWCTLCTQTQHRQSGKHRVWCTTQHSLHTNTTLTVGKTPCLMHYSTLPAHKHNTDSRENTVSDAPLSTPCRNMTPLVGNISCLIASWTPLDIKK